MLANGSGRVASGSFQQGIPCLKPVVTPLFMFQIQQAIMIYELEQLK